MAARKPSEVVAEAVAKFGGGAGNVMQLLTHVNGVLGCVPEEAMREIARASGVSSAEIQSVATFYSFYSLKPRGRHIVRLCKTISCAMKDSEAILSALEKELGIGEGGTTPDGRVTLETTNCLGLCDQSPAMLVDEAAYTGLTPEKACEVVRALE
jgi:NADH:ubiquinone oxidoreductase subunit E